MAKVNLKEIQSRLVKRGRDAYVNPELSAELLALTPDESDAFLFEEATFSGDTASEEYVNHKNLWRNRTNSVASACGIPDKSLSIQWTIDGEMIVSYKS